MSRRFSARRSAIHGRGVFALVDIPAGSVLLEYRGRLLRHAEADDLYGDSVESGHTFLFTLNDEYVVDGNVGGNSARWINHSCEPNCQALVYPDAGGDPARDRIWIEALRDIAAGEELGFDYGIVLEERHTPRLKAIWACRCGAPSCTGTMLRPRRRRTAG